MMLLFACKRIASHWALCLNPCYNLKGYYKLLSMWTKIIFNHENNAVALLFQGYRSKLEKVIQTEWFSVQPLVGKIECSWCSATDRKPLRQVLCGLISNSETSAL